MKTCSTCHAENPPDSRFCQNCGSPMLEVSGIPEDPYIGRKFLGKYLIQQMLGQGAMGKVYLAEHVVLGKKMCIKILHPHLAGDENLAKRFHREARAASRLSHPNSIQIVDFGQAEDGTLYIAMEYLAGTDLRRVIRRDFPLPPFRIVRILSQVLSALEEAHEQGIIHRDLKPENIMISDTRTDRDLVKVLDFGIAKIQDPGTEGGTLTVAGIVCGTPEYMAPEQARGDPLDRRVDLYATGVLLYQMLVGELPFKAESALATVTKHLTEMPIPPHVRRPDLAIDLRLEEICLRAMAKDRAERFPSAAVMKEELESLGFAAEPSRLAAGAAVTATPSGSRWEVGAAAAKPDTTPSLQTPLAFAVEEGPPARRERAGSIAAWVAAGAIVLLGGTAVALWKLEIGPFAPVETPVAAAQPAPPPPAPVLPKAEAAKPEPPKPAAPEAPKPAEPAKEARAEGSEREGRRPRRAVARDEDTESKLKAALSVAAAGSRPPAAAASVTPSPQPQPADQPAPQPDPRFEEPRPAPPPPRPAEVLPPPDPMRAQRAYADGMRLLSRNRVREAVDKLKEAVRFNPTTPEYHRDLGKAHFRNGNRAHGIWHYRKYLELWPDGPESAFIRKIVGQ